MVPLPKHVGSCSYRGRPRRARTRPARPSRSSSEVKRPAQSRGVTRQVPWPPGARENDDCGESRRQVGPITLPSRFNSGPRYQYRRPVTMSSSIRRSGCRTRSNPAPWRAVAEGPVPGAATETRSGIDMRERHGRTCEDSEGRQPFLRDEKPVQHKAPRAGRPCVEVACSA